MPDIITPAKRSENMKRIVSKDTSPEIIIRRLIYKLGYRYRLHRKELPGKPDIIFSRKRKLIFIHGCFWHQHNDTACKITRLPKSNLDYWIPKLKRNIERDKEHLAQLKQLGWDVLVIWECQIKDLQKITKLLISFLS